MIKFRHLRVFDSEDVVPGDILMSKTSNIVMYCVLNVDIMTEEYICISVGIPGELKSLVSRVGFEYIENYNKVYIDDTSC